MARGRFVRRVSVVPPSNGPMAANIAPLQIGDALGITTRTADGVTIIEIRIHPPTPAANRHEPPPDASLPRRLMSVQEAAQFLGISRPTMHSLLGTEIPKVYVGRSLRIRPEDIEAYISVHTHVVRGSHGARRSA
jgi:excisionase family DNA binding protein